MAQAMATSEVAERCDLAIISKIASYVALGRSFCRIPACEKSQDTQARGCLILATGIRSTTGRNLKNRKRKKSCEIHDGPADTYINAQYTIHPCVS